MKIFVAWSVDQLEGLTAAALMADNVEELRRISSDIRRASENIKAWAISVGGSPILDLSLLGVVAVPTDRMTELPGVTQRFKDACEAAVSVGVGMTISEAYVAMRHSQTTGGDKISLYEPEMDAQAHAQPRGEITDPLQYLGKADSPFKGAAFRHKISGQIHDTGPFHDIDSIPNAGSLEDYDQGFVDHAGNFYDREEAAAVINHKQTLRPLKDGQKPYLLGEDVFENNPYYASHQKQRQGAGLPQLPAMVAKAEGDNQQEPDQPVGSDEEPNEFNMDAAGSASPAPAESASAPAASATGASAAPQDAGGQQPQQDGQGQEPDPRTAVIQALQKIKAQAQVLEQMKQTNPQAFDAVKSVVAAMIVMAHGLAMEDDEGEGEVAKSETDDHEHGDWQKDEAGEYCGHCGTDKEVVDMKKAGLPMPAKTPKRIKRDWPVGHIKEGAIKVQHIDPQTGQAGGTSWHSARAGMIQSKDGHPISSRNPNGK